MGHCPKYILLKPRLDSSFFDPPTDLRVKVGRLSDAGVVSRFLEYQTMTDEAVALAEAV